MNEDELIDFESDYGESLQQDFIDEHEQEYWEFVEEEYINHQTMLEDRHSNFPPR